MIIPGCRFPARRQRRLCCVLESTVDHDAETISLTCPRCGTSVVLPLSYRPFVE